MSDLINRDDLYHDMTMKRLELHEKGLSWNEFCRGFGFAMEFVKQAPSAEPERKTGKWKPDESGNVYWICSACGIASEAFGADILYHFCPNCGAEMTRGDHE